MDSKLDNLSKRNTIILFSSFFIFSIAFYIYAIWIKGPNLSFDELYSIAMTDYSFGEIYNITAKDVHPPLFYWLLKIIEYPLGISPDLYRYHYITALFYLSSLLVCFFPVRRLLGTGTAFLTAIILVFLPVAFYTYAYVRMYSLAVPLLLGMFIYVCDVYKNNTWWAWGKLFIFSLAAMYTHYYALLGAFWLLFLFSILLVIRSSKNRQYRSYIKRYLILGLTLVICYIPWLIELYSQITAVKESYWISPPSLMEIVFSLQYYFSPKHFEEPYTRFFSSSWIILITMLAFLSILSIVILGFLSKMDKMNKKIGVFAFLTAGVTVLFILVYSYVFSPVFYVRYLSCYIGLFAVGSSIFICSLLRNGKSWQKGLVGIFFICFFFLSGVCYYLNEVRNNRAKALEDPEYNTKLEKFMEGTNGIIYTEEIMTPNLGIMSMYYPQYKYQIINDGVVPPEMGNVPDYENDPYAIAPFKHLEAVPAIEIGDKYGIYITTFPESVTRILGPDYEVTDHLEGSALYKFRKRQLKQIGSHTIYHNDENETPEP